MRRSRRWGERGQGIVEFAVIFPLFVMLVFAMIDGAMIMGRYQQVNHAANAGARTAATGADLSDVVADAKAQSVRLLTNAVSSCSSGDPNRVCVQWFDGPNGAGEVGSYVKVTVYYRYSLKTPLANAAFRYGGQGPLTISACSIARLERPYAPPSSNRRSGTPSC